MLNPKFYKSAQKRQCCSNNKEGYRAQGAAPITSRHLSSTNYFCLVISVHALQKKLSCDELFWFSLQMIVTIQAINCVSACLQKKCYSFI